MQVLGYRDTFLHESRNLRGTTETFQAYNPRCYVIVGQVAALGDDEKKSFELSRTAQAGVQVIASDEVRPRLQSIRDVLAVEDADEGVNEETEGPPEAYAAEPVVDAETVGGDQTGVSKTVALDEKRRFPW